MTPPRSQANMAVRSEQVSEQRRWADGQTSTSIHQTMRHGQQIRTNLAPSVMNLRFGNSAMEFAPVNALPHCLLGRMTMKSTHRVLGHSRVAKYLRRFILFIYCTSYSFESLCMNCAPMGNDWSKSCAKATLWILCFYLRACEQKTAEHASKAE